jgi:MFS transporter, putative metabolite:H+ symporter
LVGASAVPGFFIFFFRLVIPESPRYLLTRNRLDEATKIVKSIAFWNGKKAPEGNLVFVHSQKKTKAFFETLSDLFKPQLLLTTVLLWIIWFTLSYGSWGFSFLIPIIFEKINKTKSNIYRDSLIMVATGILGFGMMGFLINRMGRRKLMALTFFISGVFTLLCGVWSNPTYVLIMSVYVNFFSSAPWAIIYAYTPEVYPTTLRTTGMV